MIKFKEKIQIFSLILILVTSCQGVSLPPDQISNTLHFDADVIVIGAGPSGIAAATKLNQHGVDVKVFEGQSWIGGRIHSIKFGDAFVDLGAEWCHGEKDNIVFDLMKESHVLKHPNYTFAYVDSDGTIFYPEFSAELDGLFEELYAADGARNATEEDTVGTYFSKVYTQAINEKFASDPQKFAHSKLVYHTFNKFILSSEGAFSWFDPSALSDYKDCDGDHTMTWNGLGYKTILEKLMSNNFDQKRINLLREVKQIQLDEKNDIVKVLLTSGEEQTAKHVIFTPSLGVLKHDHKMLFQPELSKEKVEAIEALGIGAVMKVLLHFPTKWWDQNDTFSGFSFVWTQEDRDTLAAQFTKGPHKNELSWLSNFMGVYRVEQNPKVLSCWFTGDFVPEIELMDEKVLLNGIHFALNKFLGKSYDVQQADDFKKSTWYSSKFTRGTYSFQTIASRKINPSANLILSQPIVNKANVPKILFAGEATHPYFYSTVHGAIESGFREADRLIEILKH